MKWILGGSAVTTSSLLDPSPLWRDHLVGHGYLLDRGGGKLLCDSLVDLPK